MSGIILEPSASGAGNVSIVAPVVGSPIDVLLPSVTTSISHVLATAVLPAVGTTVTYAVSGLANRIVISLKDVSLNGSQRVTLRLSSGGAQVTAGYDGASDAIAHSDAFIFSGADGAHQRVGPIILDHMGNNVWSMISVIQLTGSTLGYSAGWVQLPGPIDGIALSNNGANTFDLGSFYVKVEV